MTIGAIRDFLKAQGWEIDVDYEGYGGHDGGYVDFSVMDEDAGDMFFLSFHVTERDDDMYGRDEMYICDDKKFARAIAGMDKEYLLELEESFKDDEYVEIPGCREKMLEHIAKTKEAFKTWRKELGS